MESDSQAQFSMVGGRFSLITFEGLMEIPPAVPASVLLEIVESASSCRNGFPVLTQQNLQEFVLLKASVRLTHLHKCERNRLSGSFPCAGH